MRLLAKSQHCTNFSRALRTRSNVFRPKNESQLQAFTTANPSMHLLARGQGLSYSDACLLHEGNLIDMSLLNHMISFDPISRVVICQAAVTFNDLLLLDPHYIPPVMPGTLNATLAGAIAHDIHGKNNHHAGSLGQHIQWMELQIGNRSVVCSPNENTDLFYATIGGLGLTGIIKRVAIRLQKASQYVTKRVEKFTRLQHLLDHMRITGVQYDYQVAWLDLLNEPAALLTLANHTEVSTKLKTPKTYTAPRTPIRLVNSPLIKLFNQFYYERANPYDEIQSLKEYNNPLDRIQHWPRIYGRKGLLQFQACFNVYDAEKILQQLLTCIRKNKAVATLAVLKYFTQPGMGLLSFTEPGFTIAIDFINNTNARKSIATMNQIILQAQGKIYLAKDWQLNAEQFATMYPRYQTFQDVLNHYQSLMRSDLSKRLGLTS